MALNALYLTIVISASVATGLKLNYAYDKLANSQSPNFPVQPFVRTIENVNDGPIAGYPKTPPANAIESGGLDGDLLPPPLPEDNRTSSKSKRSVDVFHKVDPITGYPLLADPSWKYAGGNEDSLQLPLEHSVSHINAHSPKRQSEESEEAVDPKTGYPLKAKPFWKHSGGDETNLQLPFETEPSVDLSPPPLTRNDDSKNRYSSVTVDYSNYPGGTDVKMLLDDLNVNNKVSSRTNLNNGDKQWTFVKEPSVEHSVQKAVEPKIDPHTGYPLQAEPHWKDAGGNGDILQLPIDESTIVSLINSKTEYPIAVEDSWNHFGNDGDAEQHSFIEKSSEPSFERESFETGASNSNESLELSYVDSQSREHSREREHRGDVDPKTGYPLTALPEWAEAGGNGDSIQPPIQDGESNNKQHSSGRHSAVDDVASEFADTDGLVFKLSDDFFQNGKLVNQPEMAMGHSQGSIPTDLIPPDVESVYYTGFGDDSSGVFAHGPEGSAKEFTSQTHPAGSKQPADSELIPIDIRTGGLVSQNAKPQSFQPIISSGPKSYSELHLNGFQLRSQNPEAPSLGSVTNYRFTHSNRKAHLLGRSDFRPQHVIHKTFQEGSHPFGHNSSGSSTSFANGPKRIQNWKSSFASGNR